MTKEWIEFLEQKTTYDLRILYERLTKKQSEITNKIELVINEIDKRDKIE